MNACLVSWRSGGHIQCHIWCMRAGEVCVWVCVWVCVCGGGVMFVCSGGAETPVVALSLTINRSCDSLSAFPTLSYSPQTHAPSCQFTLFHANATSITNSLFSQSLQH